MKHMKTTIGVVVALALLATVPIHAQQVSDNTNGVAGAATSTTNPPAVFGLSIPSTGIWGELGAAGKDLWNDITLMKPFTTNGNATVRAFGGMNTSTKDLIFGAMVTVPISDNFAIGALVADKGGTFYEGGANLSFGVTNNWPILGMVKSFAGDGIVYNFETREPANYAFAGFEKEWKLSDRIDLGIGVVTANTSDSPGIDIIGGVHLTYWWGKRKT